MAKARREEEKNENLETIKQDVPSSKYQDEQQIAQSTGFKTNTGETNFVLNKKKAPGSVLKQDVAASVIKDATYGGSLSGDGASFSGLRSSGGMGGVLGAANATPVGGQARGGSRTTKKLDRNSTKLNFIPNDQTLVEWDESKPLAESADEDQGFNGTYRNEFARSQKNSEAVPGGLMFDRSVDEIENDQLYFGQGQVIKQTGVAYNNDVTKTVAYDANGIAQHPAADNYAGGATSNYLTREAHVKVANDGSPLYIYYVEEDLNCQVDQHEANKSGTAFKRLMNDAELVRETMDSKAGDEKADIWTPLARAIDQPTQTVGFLRDIEAETGNEVKTAYSKASTSFSFQLNRAHKDGQDPVNPAIEALTGLNYNYVSKSAEKTGQGTDIQGVFNKAHYVHGDASLMIPLYDSEKKYNSKADLILQPRGFRMHLQTADNNMDPLYVDKDFMKVYDASEVFSTIGREYDPMAPVFLTDKCAVIHRHSWDVLGSFVKDKFDIKVKLAGTSGSATTTTVLPAHLIKMIKDAGYSLYVVYPKEGSGSISFSSQVITPSSTYEYANGTTLNTYIAKTAPTYDSSTQALISITNANLDGTKDLKIAGGTIKGNYAYVTVPADAVAIYHANGGPLEYMFSDLRNNYITRVSHPLLKGFHDYIAQSIGAKLYSLIGSDDLNIRTIHSTKFFSLWSFMLCAATPYIIKARINSMRDVLYYEKNVEYPFTSTLMPIRDVLTKAYTNFGYVNYDTELEVKRMTPAASIRWIMPQLYQQCGYDSVAEEALVLMPWDVCQTEVYQKIEADESVTAMWDDDASAMCYPSIRSGVRFAGLDALYGMSEKDVRLCLDRISSYKNLDPTLASTKAWKYSSVTDGQLVLSIDPDTMTAYDVLCLPHELGYVEFAPYGVLTPTYEHYYDLDQSVLGTSSFRCMYWIGNNPVATAADGNQQICKAITVNINRAANFTQDWYIILASGTVPPVDHGFLLSAAAAYNNGALLLGRSSFKPYAMATEEIAGAYTTNVNTVMSMQKYLWTRLQKIPFVISPFDTIAINNASTPNNVVINDPFELMYAFGLGGFRASDFRESVYNREKEVVNQGMLFTADPWVLASPIFKEGAATSEIATAKGFEL